MGKLWRFSKKSALVLFFVLGAVHVHSTSSNASAQASGFAASMPDLVLLEGTPLMEYTGSGAYILEGGQDPVAILNFSLNKPLTADAKVSLLINEELTNCPKGYLNRPLLPEDPTAFPKGTSQLSLKVTARRDDFVDEDCQAQFSLKVAYPDREELIHAAGKLTLKDDDVETGNTYLDYNHASIRRGFGDVSQYALNGSRAFTGQTYEVEQLAGVPAIFTVVKDKLRVLIPAPDTGARDGDDQFPFVFLVKPSNAPSFKVWWSAWTSLDEPIYQWDENEVADETIYDRTGIKTLSAQGYIRDHFYDGDLTKLSWSLTTAQPSNYVKFYGSNDPLHPNNIAVTPEEAKIVEQGKGIYLDADNRTIRITPAAATVLSRYINDTKTFKLGLDLETCEDSSKDADCITTTAYISLRPAIKTLKVNVAGIDSELMKTPDRFFVVVRDMYEGTDRYTTRILPLTKPNLVFEAMHTAQYKIILVDMQGEYSGDASQPLYEKERNKTIKIEAAFDGALAIH